MKIKFLLTILFGTFSIGTNCYEPNFSPPSPEHNQATQETEELTFFKKINQTVQYFLEEKTLHSNIHISRSGLQIKPVDTLYPKINRKSHELSIEDNMLANIEIERITREFPTKGFDGVRMDGWLTSELEDGPKKCVYATVLQEPFSQSELEDHLNVLLQKIGFEPEAD